MLTPSKSSQMDRSSTSPVFLFLEQVVADDRKPSQRNGTVSFDLEDIYVKPVSHSCTLPSPNIIEALKRNSKSPAPTNEVSSSLAGPSLLTFKKLKKGILGNFVNRNLITGNQTTTPIKSLRDPVPKGQDQIF